MPRINIDDERRVQLPQQQAPRLNFEAARQRGIQRQAPAQPATTTTLAGFPVAEPEPIKKSFMEKLLSLTGGDRIARGAGLGIAQAGTKRTMDEIQQGEGEMQQKLIQAIRNNRQVGKDTSRLEASLKALTGGIAQTGESANDMYTEGITSKQIVGDALQLATTVASVGALPGMAKNAVKPGLMAGIKAGVKTGAVTGGGFGAATGFSQGLKDDKSIADSLKQAAGGLATGAAGGALLGGLTGGVAGKIRDIKLNKANSYLDAITPKTSELTPTEYEKLLSRGKIRPKTATEPARYILSERELATAAKYKHLISTNDPVKNTINVVEEIAKKDDEVGQFLGANNGIFNSGQLKNKILERLADITDVTIDEGRLTIAKEEMATNFVNSLKKKDLHSLWLARKLYDQKIERAFTGAPTLQNQIKTEFRNAIQEFISEKTPDTVYSKLMREMSDLFTMKDVLTTKATKEKAHNAIQLWIKRHPTKSKVVGWGLGTGIVGTIGTSIMSD